MLERSGKGRSLIDFPREYVSVDVETTGLDFEYDEIIEVGAVLVRDGKPVDTFSSLIRPNRSHALLTGKELEAMGYSNFRDMPDSMKHEYHNTHLIDSFIENLTGIKNENLFSASSFKDVMPKFLTFIKGKTLVGHNVNFDVNFLYDACYSCGEILSNDFVDAMRISKRLYPDWEHHRLIDLVENLGVAPSTHRALDDAIATAQCFEKMRCAVIKTQTIQEFAETFRKKHKRQHNYKTELASITPTVSEFDDTNPFFGKVVVFTGALSSMTRKEAFQLVANLGGYPESGITKKTNFLVVGSEEFAASVKNGRTRKMIKADEYKEKGFDICTLSENTFFEIVKQ